jgi:hypothetical protein
MESEEFFTVDPEQLKQITIADLQSGHSLEQQKLDYSILIPTRNQSIPRRRWNSLYREDGRLNFDAGDRGRFRGC